MVYFSSIILSTLIIPYETVDNKLGPDRIEGAKVLDPNTRLKG